MNLNKTLRASWVAVRHPAFLFSAGNTALAIGQAEPVAITLNIALAFIIFGVRFTEVSKAKKLGTPFSILAGVNIFTAFSVEFNRALGNPGSSLFEAGIRRLNFHEISTALSSLQIHNLLSTQRIIVAAHISAFAYISWAIGHLLAGWHEKNGTIAKHSKDNPQVYYGAGDLSALNASGSVNLYSVVIMVMGFIKSTLIGRAKKEPKNAVTKFIREELTSARLYGISFVVGAATSFAIPHFAVAQVCWALAYFQFKKDT